MTHPVDELDQAHFDAAAQAARDDLHSRYSALVTLEPGDGTRYQIAIVVDGETRCYMASNFGALYPVRLDITHHWDYVNDHYLSKQHEWTARVLTRFLNALHAALKEAVNG